MIVFTYKTRTCKTRTCKTRTCKTRTMSSLTPQSRNRLETIANIFRANHVFNRKQKCPRCDDNLTRDRVYAKNYTGCVSSIEELHIAQNWDHELYTASMNYFKEEQKIIRQEWDERHPPKLFVNFNIERYNGDVKEQWRQYAEYAAQVGLVMFDNKFYGTNAQGGPDGDAQYEYPRPIRDLSKERDDAIATFAEVLLSL
jgi:hypothetical protein